MSLLSDDQVIERVFDHIDNNTTDLGTRVWREPTENYRSDARFEAERSLFRRLPLVFCPAAALAEPGSYVARQSAGVPVVAVRGEDGQVRAFRNVCRHRGVTLAEGKGCAKAFVCGYHGWTYGLDGTLRHVPGEHGFPGLDKARHGLSPLRAEERHGLIFVTQEDPIDDGALAACPDLFAPEQAVIDGNDYEDDVNWKLNQEAAMEGYHIKMTHGKTFYPYGFDNLNVVETFGPNSRITFPFRRIEKLRDIAPAKRRIGGYVTYVYHLFPNAIAAVLSDHTVLLISEPLSPSRTRFTTYRLTNRGADGSAEAIARAKKDAAFVNDTGSQEDRAVVRAIQSGLESGANSHFTYGHFETAIVHFHATLTDLLNGSGKKDSQ